MLCIVMTVIVTSHGGPGFFQARVEAEALGELSDDATVMTRRHAPEPMPEHGLLAVGWAPASQQVCQGQGEAPCNPAAVDPWPSQSEF